MNNRLTFRRFFAPDDPGATNPTSPPTQTPPTQKPPITEQTAQELIEAITSSKRVNGDSEKALNVLAGQVLAKERRITELTDELAESKGNLPPELKVLKAFIDDQGGLEAVKTSLSEGAAAVTERDAIKREQTMRAACEAAGIDYADFSTRKGVDDWAYDVKDETKDGQTVKVPYVTFNDTDGKPVTKPLGEKAVETFPTLAKANEQGRAAMPPMGFSNGGGTDEFAAIRAKREAENKAAANTATSWREEAGVARKN